VLLFITTLLALLFDMLPVFLASALSALVWNFFFIPPTFTFHIDNQDDLFLFLTYFIVASVNSVLNYKLRIEEKKSHEREQQKKTIELYNTIFNSLSHELRTPLATMLSSTELLQAGVNEETQKELVGEINAAAFRLNGQLNNLLLMSRLESGMLQPNNDWIDVKDLLRVAVVHAEVPTTHNVKVQIDDAFPFIKSDFNYLQHILTNLVRNASTHTPEGTAIVLNATSNHEGVVFEVSDNGPGIPSELKQIVFEKFYRIPGTSAGGTGLGLSIAKGFADALGGRIGLQNTSASGAHFTIELPCELSYINALKHE
jgi:two-component system sensor histidine kinase KdpD